MAVVFFFWRGQGPAISVLLGCSLGLLNFLAQRYATAKLVRSAATGETSGLSPVVLFLMKYVGLGVALFVILRVERIDVIGFTAGFFSYIVAIVAVGGSTGAPPVDASTERPIASDSRAD